MITSINSTPPVLYKVEYTNGCNDFKCYFHADDQQDAMQTARKEVRRIFALYPDSTVAGWVLTRESDKQLIASDYERA